MCGILAILSVADVSLAKQHATLIPFLSLSPSSSSCVRVFSLNRGMEILAVDLEGAVQTEVREGRRRRSQTGSGGIFGFFMWGFFGLGHPLWTRLLSANCFKF